MDDVLNAFLDAVFLVSNKDLQRKAWIQGIGPGCYDYDENMIDFLNYSSLILDNPGRYNINEYQIYLIKIFKEKYELFYDEDDPRLLLPEMFIDSLRWTEITESAKKILDAFSCK